MSIRLSVVGGAVIALAACHQDLTDPVEPPLTMQCLPEVCGGGGGGGGGGGSTVGIYLGPELAIASCYSPAGAGISDADVDRFDDWCEGQIAYAFRPMLVSHPLDCNIGREPAWGVRYFPGTGVVRILYLLSYYQDCGNDYFWGCYTSPGAPYCLGHEGDSEFIVLEVSELSAGRYAMLRAFTSAHYASGGDASTISLGTQLGYVGNAFGVPVFYVARGKHGSYRSLLACEDGGGSFPPGTGGSDSCSGNTIGLRLEFVFNRNVGSASRHLLDCTLAKPAMQYYRPGMECYWDGYSPTQSPPPERFFGWWDPAGNVYAGGASPYGPIIRDFLESESWPPFLAGP